MLFQNYPLDGVFPVFMLADKPQEFNIIGSIGAITTSDNVRHLSVGLIKFVNVTQDRDNIWLVVERIMGSTQSGQNTLGLYPANIRQLGETNITGEKEWSMTLTSNICYTVSATTDG